MRDRSLVAFTLLLQTAAGMTWGLAAARLVPGATPYAPGPLLVVGGMTAAGIGAAFLHLGSPRHAWLALAGLRTSWLSREILFTVLFAASWGLTAGIALFGGGAGITGGAGAAAGLSGAASTAPGAPGAPITAASPGHLATLDAALELTALMGAVLVYAMSRVYRLRTVPAWDTWRTPVRFFLAAAVLGGLAAALALTVVAGKAMPGIGPDAGAPRLTPAILTLALAVAAVAAVVARVRFYDVLSRRGL